MFWCFNEQECTSQWNNKKSNNTKLACEKSFCTETFNFPRQILKSSKNMAVLIKQALEPLKEYIRAWGSSERCWGTSKNTVKIYEIFNNK